MNDELAAQYEQALSERQANRPEASAVELVNALLVSAQAAHASDIHLVPDDSGLNVFWRLDGVLQPVTEIPKSLASNMVARLKVLADLLTYRTEVPQEGRIRHFTSEPEGSPADGSAASGDARGSSADVEMRLSTFPTMHGEKAVVRLFVGSGTFRNLNDLGLTDETRCGISDLLLESGGVFLVCGPAGSGKTTTIYASLREVVDKSGGQRSLVSLEDPIEAALAGVAQSQVNPAAGFDYDTGLKSLMRQDPEVILVGEIRDRGTAETVFQAALTGHLVLTTFHAGSAAEAICRLSDMGIEPYLLRSGLLAILSQRLLRRLCTCSKESSNDADRLGLNVAAHWIPHGCEQCRGTGYRGRLLLTEFLRNEATDVGKAILSRSDADELEQLAVQTGMKTRWQHGLQAVSAGQTSPAELLRVFGRGRSSSPPHISSDASPSN
ncbi:MAG: GspE/PulE family protein [Planctomycetota bacterium]|jgi:type II secretory ATPase GspE/PulE/Tfp pilus assembly ATPase PilB-like protein